MVLSEELVGRRPRIFTGPSPADPIEAPPVVLALRHAAADPGRTAVVDGATGERLSRGELAERSAAVAEALAARDIGPGDVVAVAMPNLWWWPVVALGIWRAGAAVAALSPRWTARELARVLGRVRPRLAVAFEPAAPAVGAALSEVGVSAEILVHREAGTELRELLAPAVDDEFAEPVLDPAELAVIPFSSGTSGLPKGVRRSHGNLAAEAAQTATAFSSSGSFDADSVTLASAPFFHALGLGAALATPLSAGATIVTVPGPETGRILALIGEHGVTHMAVPPPIAMELATDPRADLLRGSRLGFVAVGGAHVPVSVQRFASERLGAVVRQGYGMSEAGMISAPMGQASDPATVGWLTPGTEARLVDPKTGRDATDGQAGELWIRGPSVMDGYHNDPSATADAFSADGWLRTGDLARFRDDGQLVIQDRLKELIKVGGASVSPAEIELVLREHPSVRDAAVVGRPHPEYGEVPVAHVILEPPIGHVAPGDLPAREELIAFVEARVAPHKRLHDLRVVDSLPRMPSGKLLRRELRRWERSRAAG